jgi:hypothetical protein
MGLSSAATRGGGVFCSLEQCKKADLMMVDRAVLTVQVPGAAGEGGEAQTRTVYRQGAVQGTAILQKSGKKLEKN